MASPAAAKYAALKEKMADARKQMEETAKTAFNEMAEDLFTDNPTLVAFGWQQYTPYFNDGDVCTFRCNTDYPTLAIKIGEDVIKHDSNLGELEINGEEVQGTYEYVQHFEKIGADSYSKDGKLYAFDKKSKEVTVDGAKIPTYKDYEKQFDAVEDKVTGFLGAFEDDDMQTMFGDHMTITVNRGGKIDMEEYEHD